MIKKIVLSCFCASFFIASTALAEDLIIFPNKGQSQEQQNKERGECHVWAVDQTGFDPALTSTAAKTAPQAAQGGLFRGAARGAIAGVAIGAIAGDAGKGAAIGATAGGMHGSARRQDQYRQQATQQRNAQAAQDAKRAKYRRALTACLEGKGYTVK